MGLTSQILGVILKNRTSDHEKIICTTLGTYHWYHIKMIIARLKDMKVIFTKIIGAIINQNLYFYQNVLVPFYGESFFLISQFFLFISSQQDLLFFCFFLFKFVKCNNRFHNKDTPKLYILSNINIEKQLLLLIWPDKNGLVSDRQLVHEVILKC